MFSKKLIFSLLLSSITSFASAQKEANVWYFGDGAGLDFNETPPKVLTNGKINTVEGSSSICDSLGNLLYYTDGVSLLNKNHVDLANYSLKGNYSTSQTLLLKQPGNNPYYYVFTLDYAGYPSGLRYSKINAILDTIEEKNIELRNAPMSEKITAVKHYNGRDI